MHIPELLVFEPRSFVVETATEEQNRHKSTGINQILTELIQAGGNALCLDNHNLINSICDKGELPQQLNKSITYLNIKRMAKLTEVIVQGYDC
jgi:hypothetical protein